MTYILLR